MASGTKQGEDEYHVCNAIIEAARVTLDHDCFLSVWLHLKYDGGGQGFGGYVLGGLPDIAAGRHTEQPNIAGEFLVRCMMAGEVTEFDKLVGKSIRVRKAAGDGWGQILGIGHIIREDRWFNPRETFAAMKARIDSTTETSTTSPKGGAAHV